MIRRIGAASTAFAIFFAVLWFPVLTVCAETGITETPAQETPADAQPEAATPANTNADSAIAQPTSVEIQGGYVYSFEDLQNRMDEGGEVHLGDHITIPQGKSIDLGGTSVHTAEFGIIVKGKLALGSGTTITGEGVAQPVIEVLSGGSLYIEYSEFDDTPGIEATGNGGHALALREGSECGQHPYLPSFLNVTANGEGSIAILSEIELDLAYFFIKAEKGTGIVCDKDIKLFLCKITAVKSADAPNLTADTCVLSSAASESCAVTEITRKIIKLESGAGASSNRGWVAIGDPLPNYINSPDYMRPFTATLHAEGYDDILEEIYVTMDAPDTITNVAGIYPVKINTEAWLSAFDLVPKDAELYHIEVYDTRIPCFKGTFSSFWGTYDVCYLYRGDDLSGLTLLRSDDEGASWYEYTTDDIELNRYREELILFFSEIPEHPVWLVWKAEGVGESQILRVTWDSDDNYGGDRIGDREEQPPMLIRPPTSPPDDSDGETPATPQDSPDNEAPTTPPTDSGDETPTTLSANPDGRTTTTSSGRTSAISSGRTSATSQVSEKTTDKTTESNHSGESISPESAPQALTVETPMQAAPIPAPTSVTHAEYSDETGVTVSGARLAVMMAANPEYVSFMQGELRASLPTAFLESLNLTDSDIFTVELTMPDESMFSVYFAVNSKELTQRFDEPFLISLPWNGGPVSCTSQNGESTVAALDSDRAIFYLHEAGNYTLSEQTAEVMASANNAPVQPSDTTSPNEPVSESPKPYADSIVPVAVVASVSLAGAGAYLGFMRIRPVMRP